MPTDHCSSLPIPLRTLTPPQRRLSLALMVRTVSTVRNMVLRLHHY